MKQISPDVLLSFFGLCRALCPKIRQHDITGSKMHRTTQWHPKPHKQTRGAYKHVRGGMRGMLLASVDLSRSTSHLFKSPLFDLTKTVACAPCAQATASMGGNGACYALRTPVRRGSKIRVRCAIARGEMERLRDEADEAGKHTTLTMIENYGLRSKREVDSENIASLDLRLARCLTLFRRIEYTCALRGREGVIDKIRNHAHEGCNLCENLDRAIMGSKS